MLGENSRAQTKEQQHTWLTMEMAECDSGINWGREGLDPGMSKRPELNLGPFNYAAKNQYGFATKVMFRIVSSGTSGILRQPVTKISSKNEPDRSS